ncbi:hypothetical protein [Mycolicibacterium brisbanense]|uniref:hypothetical protein n=1 Tax=Mycolicibacterium brisbanense TaxID=146020 RepID=UPI00041CA739|nr:hypothetical protein [Mycolicibacterium brisbanense]MCV7160678.1 hypothetical protein [Mycolicibacterium brisbanense]
MIGAALFVFAGVLYVYTNYQRERTVPEDGASRLDRGTALLVLETVCCALGAVAVAVVHMMTFVS